MNSSNHTDHQHTNLEQAKLSESNTHIDGATLTTADMPNAFAQEVIDIDMDMDMDMDMDIDLTDDDSVINTPLDASSTKSNSMVNGLQNLADEPLFSSGVDINLDDVAIFDDLLDTMPAQQGEPTTDHSNLARHSQPAPNLSSLTYSVAPAYPVAYRMGHQAADQATDQATKPTINQPADDVMQPPTTSSHQSAEDIIAKEFAKLTATRSVIDDTQNDIDTSPNTDATVNHNDNDNDNHINNTQNDDDQPAENQHNDSQTNSQSDKDQSTQAIIVKDDIANHENSDTDNADEFIANTSINPDYNDDDNDNIDKTVITPSSATIATATALTHPASAIPSASLATAPPTSPPKHVKNRHAVVNASVRRRQWRTRQQEQRSIFDRLFYAVICGVMLGLVGGLVDVMLMVIRSLTTSMSAVQWLFAPILAVIGVLLGLFARNRAGGYAMQLLNVFGSDSTGDANDGGLFKAIGLGLVLSCLGYVMLMMMA